VATLNSVLWGLEDCGDFEQYVCEVWRIVATLNNFILESHYLWIKASETG
jgi:hypothetical protein